MKYKEIVIASSKTKLIFIVAGSIAFISLGVWFLTLDIAFIEAQRRFNNPALIYSVGIVVVSFFSICVLIGVWKLFDKEPGLVISEDGLKLSPKGPISNIPWRDISGLSIYEVHKQKMLVVNLYDPHKYINVGGKIHQNLAKASYKMAGSPITISSVTLNISFEDLCAICIRYYEHYCRAA